MLGVATLCLVIGILTLYFVNYYLAIKRFPPGPFPLPIIGSLLVFLKRKENISAVFNELAKKYDGIYTLWVGSVPFVFIANWELTKESLVTKRNDVISRPHLHSIQGMLKDIDAIVFHDNDKEWSVCRNVAYSSVRKFSDSETLARIVHECIVKMLDEMLALKQPVNAKYIIQNTIFDIIAQTAFGTEKLSESDAQVFRDHMKVFHECMMISPGDFFPILSPLFRHIDKKIQRSNFTIKDFLEKKFPELIKMYKTDEVKHFADSIIWSKNEADEKDSGNKQYLTDDNMKKILSDLFLAGTDTTSITLQWLFLALAQFPEIQNRIREEILQNIGNRIPEQEDKLICPYTWAFISEILRLRSPVPMMIPHSTSYDTELGGHKIPKGTAVVFDVNATHFDPKVWEEPEKVKPERFLDVDGQYTKSRLQGYLAFGEGKRNCIGEKMARNDLFLAIATTVQKVKIASHDSKDANLLEKENNPFFSLPKDFEITILPNV